MGRSRYRPSYRKTYPATGSSPAARLQFGALVELVESEDQRLARRSTNVLGQMSRTLAANLETVQKVLDAPSAEQVGQQCAQRLMLAEAGTLRMQEAANDAYRAQALPTRWLVGVPQPERRQLDVARAELRSAQSAWEMRTRHLHSHAGVPSELRSKPAVQAFANRARVAQTTLQRAISQSHQREQQRGTAQPQHNVQPRAVGTHQRTGVAASRDQAMKAKAATVDARAREHAEEVKKRLGYNHPCPYCGGALGSDRHADHIQPVSHGGLSTEFNMVYVCSSCNLRKSDMTLREFVRKQGLDRDAVEGRLERLDKRF